MIRRAFRLLHPSLAAAVRDSAVRDSAARGPAVEQPSRACDAPLRLRHVAVLALFAACGGGGDGIVQQNPPAVVVSMAPTSATVNVGVSTSFAVSITGGSPTPTLSSCSSSSTAVATASSSGSSCAVTAVSAGSATITATTSGGQTSTAQLTVEALPPALTAFTLTPPTASLTVGQTLTLNAAPTSAPGATVIVSYVSGTTAVASVSGAGVVTALSPGTAVITATAQGTGSGLTATTLVRTATVTVSADPCAPITITLPASRSSSVTAGSCPLDGATVGGGDRFRFNLPTAAAISVSLAPTGFAPYIAALPASESEFIFNSRPTTGIVSGRWHLPAGLTEVRAGALNPSGVGNFQLEVQAVSPSVENCQIVLVGGSVSSNQALQTTDCASGGFFADEFLVFSSKPCVITMARSTLSSAMDDPFLQVLAGTDTVMTDDDSGGGTNARISLASCRSSSNNVLRVRASSFASGDVGTYSISFSFGAAAVGAEAAVGSSSAVRVAKTGKGPRLRAPGSSAVVNAGDWLGRIGVGTNRRER